MLSAICEMQKRDWDKSSMPKLLPKDRSRGIYFTCPDAVVMAANLNRHLNFLKANIKFLNKNIGQHPEILRLGQDMANVGDLLKHVQESESSLRSTSQQLISLRKTLTKCSRDPNFSTPDVIHSSNSSHLSKAIKVSLFVANAALVPYVAFKTIKYVMNR